MKITKITALLALCGLAASARAQVQAGLNDLILGFRASGGQGQNVNLEVDLGSVAQFSNASGPITVSRLAVADLVTNYGSNWASRTDLVWGVVGSAGRVGAGGPGGQPLGTIWGTKAEPAPGTQSIAFTPGSRTAQFNASSAIEPLYSAAPGSLTGAAGTNSSAINATLSGSYAAQDTLQSGESFGFFNPSVDNSTTLPAGAVAVSDLYELQPGAATAKYLGSFGLSSAGVLTFQSFPSGFVPGAPAITAQPPSQTIAAGAAATFSVTASGNAPLTYQWSKNGVAIPGATASSYTISSVQATDSGTYTVAITNSLGSVTSASSVLTVGGAGTLATAGRLINLSVLTTLGVAPDNFTVGFIFGGTGTSGSKPVLVRASGPSLSAFNLGVPLSDDPKIVYYNGTTQQGANDNWGGDATVTQISAQVGAFPLAGATSKDAALYLAAAAAGNDSVVVSSGGTVTGDALAEVYDATPAASFTLSTPRLINESVLKNMGTLLTVGFTVGGSTPRNLLIRAVGPSLGLAPFNLPGVAADPKLALFAAGATTAMQTNDNWGGTPALTSAMTTSGAFTLPAGSLDAAMVVQLSPGGYTVQVTPSGGATGQVLVDIYELP